MNQLLGPNGKPISSPQNKKADTPIVGNAFGAWAGRDVTYTSLPGGGVVQFDLSRLQVADFRNMRDHYQVNSSLSVLSFMLHQSKWHIECTDPKIADFCTEQLTNCWTMLNRGLSQAHWAGYSPMVIDWENDIPNRSVDVGAVKDLIPEECRVNWKQVQGWAPPGRIPPTYKEYNGILQYSFGYDGYTTGQNMTIAGSSQTASWPIPAENTLWYPILMENGDYYGKKLLRPAFTPWFFSLLVHLFSNRYYERFGEPVPIGRAPFDEEIDAGTGGEPIQGSEYMMKILQNLRSRGVIVLPNDRTDNLTGSHPTYDYDIEYLESQMRGADFERYLTRLDEEISLGLFTPILLMRTADVGSYNLGVGHTQMYLWMLNTLNADRACYIDDYMLSPLVDYNFSPNAPRARIVYQELGNLAGDMMQSLITALIQNHVAYPDLDQLGQMAGLDLKQIKQTVAPPAAPVDPAAKPGDPGYTEPTEDGDGGSNAAGLKETSVVIREITARVKPQVENAFRDHTFGPDTKISMGYRRRFEKTLAYDGVKSPVTSADEFYTRLDAWIQDIVSLGESEFSGPEAFMAMFERVLSTEVERIALAQK